MAFNNSIFPIASEVNSSDHLVIGGCDVINLVEEFGSPLYIYDEVTLRSFDSPKSKLYKQTKKDIDHVPDPSYPDE